MSGLRVIHEDERLVAVNKPAGQLVIPGRGAAPGEPLVREVEAWLGGKAWVVHRLDREASGLVLFAKTAAAHRWLCALFEQRRIKKTYLAAVAGRVERDGELAQPLKEFGSGRVAVSAQGKPSLTRYKVVRRWEKASLLEVDLVTGRRHQIRVHLCAAGHPILGDPLYGSPRPVGGAPRLMLHALEAAFSPAPGEPALRLRAEPPPDFDKVLNLL